jgi:integrase
VHERKLAVNTIVVRISALRFFFVKTVGRPYQREDLPSPRRPKSLPTVLSPEEVARLPDSASNLFHYAILRDDVSGEEFIRRFLLHVLPPGFVRIRSFGFLANCHRKLG